MIKRISSSLSREDDKTGLIKKYQCWRTFEILQEILGSYKMKIISYIFAEKLVLEKGKIATPVFTEPLQLIKKMSETLEHSNK